MKRSRANLEDVAELGNLARAFYLAAKGKRAHAEVIHYRENLLENLTRLGEAIRRLTVEVGHYKTFRIFDPKPRVIHAPCFEERVLHHALMAVMGPVIERRLVHDTFACRPNKGPIVAVHRAQQHLRRYPWFVKVDVRKYFYSIDHRILMTMLERRFKDPGLLALCAQILAGHETTLGKGLPIGALTSQWFANLYLSALDEFLYESVGVSGMVRYMDDAAWWHRDRAEAKASLRAVTAFVNDELALTLHDNAYVQRSTQGLSFLSFRVYPHTLRLSRRRKARYRKAVRQWETAYRLGLIDAAQLQAGATSAEAIIHHADSRAWRARELERRPQVDA